MNMKFKKGFAALYSALTLAFSGMTALPANAQETLNPEAREDFNASVINLVADQVYAEPGETVEYSVYVLNNSVFSICHFTLNYDNNLTPELLEGYEHIPMAKVTYNRDITEDLNGNGSVLNDELCILGLLFGAPLYGGTDKSGKLATVWFTVPETAKAGDIFSITLDVSRFQYDSENVNYAALDGWIQIKEPTSNPETTTSTTTTETTTSTATTETTTSTATTETTTSTTTTETTTSTTTTETTTSTATTETTTSTTTTETTTSTETTETTTSTTTTETTTSTTTTEPTALTMGDIDGNGAVELDDAQLALAAYTNQLAHKPSGLNAEQEKAADVTGDGEVTVDDAQAILQFYTETLAHKDPTWDKILHPDNR